MFISTLAAPGGRPLLRHGGLRPLGQEQQDQQPQLRVQTVPVGGPAADRARVPVRDSVTRDTWHVTRDTWQVTMLQVVPGAADELRREHSRGAAHFPPVTTHHQLHHARTALSSLLSRQLKLSNTLSYLLYLFLEIQYTLISIKYPVLWCYLIVQQTDQPSPLPIKLTMLQSHSAVSTLHKLNNCKHPHQLLLLLCCHLHHRVGNWNIREAIQSPALALSYLRHYYDTMLNEQWPTVSRCEIGMQTKKYPSKGFLKLRKGSFPDPAATCTINQLSQLLLLLNVSLLSIMTPIPKWPGKPPPIHWLSRCPDIRWIVHTNGLRVSAAADECNIQMLVIWSRAQVIISVPSFKLPTQVAIDRHSAM